MFSVMMYIYGYEVMSIKIHVKYKPRKNRPRTLALTSWTLSRLYHNSCKIGSHNYKRKKKKERMNLTISITEFKDYAISRGNQSVQGSTVCKCHTNHGTA
ncbi:hypothetical protein L1987_36240 [Smallanthus sonchifolius]|uniref:Uncharacterized protein n=1 Tax=Smallanthus sonchifolius TaxID=185202 RepID=A0ACB9HD02_9ASTR|nr:hypothetical protein L1987_36240 [Smallanthus sonchifolius]